jgi:outer membrane immunogenic protein
MFRPNSLLLSSALLLATAVAAQAADAIAPARVPVPLPAAPPSAAAAYDWTGFYAGLNAGYGWGLSRWSDPLAGHGRTQLDGATLGGHFGYNWQAGAMVFGVETDAAWANLTGTPNPGSGVCATGPCEIKQNWIGTTRGRIGYAFGYWMPYVTAGAAYGGIQTTLPWGTASSTRFGWSAGAGLEVGLSKNWSAKLEYTHLDLGTASFFNAASSSSSVSIPVKDDLVRAGISYHW